MIMIGTPGLPEIYLRFERPMLIPMLMTRGRYLLPRASLYEQLVYPLLPGGGGEGQDRAVPPPWHQRHDQWVIVALTPVPRSPIESSLWVD
jgi:hypothetical protein